MSVADEPAAVPAGHLIENVVLTPDRQHFSKAQRLLVPFDFKQVFDNNRFKASHATLLLLALPSDTVDAPARLGLVIAKKHAKLAVQRNRIKRQLRESFRLHQQFLVGLDIVALARPNLWQLDNASMRDVIEAQWQRLIKQKQRAGRQ